MSTYAWTIDTDHLAAEDIAEGVSPLTGDGTGTAGPSTAPDALLEALSTGTGHHFTLYDDDAVPYYTGRATCAPGQEGTDNFCVGPLRDYGAPNAGCTLITWGWPTRMGQRVLSQCLYQTNTTVRSNRGNTTITGNTTKRRTP